MAFDSTEILDAQVLSLAASSLRLRPARAAEQLNVTRSALDRSIGRLMAAGLVSSIANPNDARSRLVCLTPAGTQHVLEARSLALEPVALAKTIGERAGRGRTAMR
jgi:DNA-binding MarR family transcriptional regulator